jgi:hypothetical protein
LSLMPPDASGPDAPGGEVFSAMPNVLRVCAADTHPRRSIGERLTAELAMSRPSA